MALPNFLIADMRAVFRACAQQHRTCSRRHLTSTTVWFKDSSSQRKSAARQSQWPYNGALTHSKSSNATPSKHGSEQAQAKETDIVPRQKEQTALDTDRRVPVPLRAIPKAQITPNLKLSPRERLHIEVLTRQQPRAAQEKPIYRERLQIYHMGTFKENCLAVLKVSTITCACAVTFVIGPAHLNAGTEPLILALIWLGGFVPLFLVNYMTNPIVSRIFLDLPASARETSKAAMEYAKNLPRDASIDIRYLPPWALEKSVKGRVSEFEPTKGNIIRPLAFKWKAKFKNTRPSPRFSPTTFFVSSKTAFGEESKDTIPGIWETVYKQLMRTNKDVEVAKWEKPGNGLSMR